MNTLQLNYMSKIGIFFGPEKGSVDKVAHIIAGVLGVSDSDVISVNSAKPSDFSNYSHIVFGISTVGRSNWDSDDDNSDWDNFSPKLKDVDFTGKTVAIFGLGDQLTYPGHFVNAIGWLSEKLTKLGVNVVGACSTNGYRFDDSEAIKDKMFIGLPIDEDNEPEFTLDRVNKWVANLKTNYNF